MSGFAEVPLEDEAVKREALQDECQQLGEAISAMAGVIDELEKRLDFVLRSQFKTDDGSKECIPELGPGRSDSCNLVREYRTRLVYLTQGLVDIIKRLDL
jgi:hypothetical protein